MLQSQQNKLKKTITNANRKIDELEREKKALAEEKKQLKDAEQQLKKDNAELDRIIITRADNIVKEKLATTAERQEREYQNRLETLKNQEKIAWVKYISNAAVIPLFALIFAIFGLITNTALLTDAIETGKMLLLPFAWVLGWGATWAVTAVCCILIAGGYIIIMAGVIYLIKQFLEDFGDKKTQIVFFAATAAVVFFGSAINVYPFLNVFMCYIVVLAVYATYRIIRGR